MAEKSLADINRPVVKCGDSADFLRQTRLTVDLSFLDPPFNQGRFYRQVDDNLDADVYWRQMRDMLILLREKTSNGGSVYFMQREKNAAHVLNILQETGWTFQNLIIWKKMTSAVPSMRRYGKHYQIIVLATKGKTARVFNRLRIDPPPPPHHKFGRERGVYLTDLWDDIRELTSGYFAGSEPLRTSGGERFHKQQSPLALLARIILSSSHPNDVIFDPYAGTGTTLLAARQLERRAVGVELDMENCRHIKKRLADRRAADDLQAQRWYYRYTDNLGAIWPPAHAAKEKISPLQKHARVRLSSV